MRILTLTNLYPTPFEPNRATFNRAQLRLLGQAYPTRIIAPIAWTDELRFRRGGKPPLPKSRQVELDGLKVDHPRYYHVPGAFRSWQGALYYRSVRHVVSRVIHEFKPTILYAPWIYPDGWAAVKFARRFRIPVVLKAHGSDVLLLNQYPSRTRGTVQALQAADGVVAVSQNLAESIERLGIDPAKIKPIYNALDSTLFSPGPKGEARAKLGVRDASPFLLFVGNLKPVKGIDVLLKACAEFRSQQHPFQLHVIGDGPLRQQLVEQADHLGISPQVHWHGSMAQSQLPTWYQAADVLVLPSRSEGVPNVLLEAVGCNTPWVASRVGGIPEINHFGGGRMVEPESSRALANAIRASLKEPPRFASQPRSPGETVAELADFLAASQRRFAKASEAEATQLVEYVPFFKPGW